MRTIDSTERRARLARRHALVPAERTGDVVEAARRVVCLHATDPSTVFLSAWARVEGMTVGDLEHALYEERTLVKQLAMRRTLFVVPREELGLVLAAASERVAGAEWRRLVKEVEKSGLHPDGEAWLREAAREVRAALAGGREATSTELRGELAVLRGTTTFGEGTTWGGESPVGPRVLTVLSASGEIVRAGNDGGWTSSRPRWAVLDDWVGPPAPYRPPTDEAIPRLVERWLRAFGPGTAADIKWWLGGTVTAVRTALRELRAVEVDLDGAVGYVLPDDVEPVDPVEPWAALLPSLDPTTMGWFERDWYLGAHREHVFDTNGNAGPTAWWDGRIVGGWTQDAGGGVHVQLLERLPAAACRALDAEAARLTGWLDGTRVPPRFPSPLSKEPPVRPSADGPR